MIGLAIFSISEFFAAFSPNISLFLIARLLQGVGYACIFPNVFAYISELFEEKNQGKAIGLFMLFTYIATGTAGIIAGLLIDNLGWNAIFIFSGSFSLMGLVLISIFVPNVRHNKKVFIDFLGGILFLLAITTIVTLPLVISNFGLTSLLTISVVVLATVFISALVIVERKAIAP